MPENDGDHQKLSVVAKILKWLSNYFDSDEIQQLHNMIFVPVTNDDERTLVLKPADQVVYLDEELQWISNKDEAIRDILQDYFLIHPSISYEIARKLQLKPLNTVIANSEEFCFEQAGQSEPLTTRLNNILREYKDTSVIQELVQNADDAGATEVAIYYDTREHDSSHLFFPGMANSYGPALLFYNNAEFSEEDFENIRKLAGKTKIDKPLKIGKFGVGFCSVYHITDVPSFVSGESFVVFDPTLQCLSKEIKSEFNPGIKINFNKHILLKKSKQLHPYAGICGFDPKKNFKGTLFRFPLRNKSSKISENIYTEANILELIDRVTENSFKLLMFLNCVQTLSVYKTTNSTFVKCLEVTATKVKYNNCHHLTISTTSQQRQHKETWLIAKVSDQLQTNCNEYNHGTASVSVKLDIASNSKKFCATSVTGECFCFLPLNIETGLPVHVSSNFAVMTNRRGIWKADDVNTATKESNWNRILMESVVVKAYINLLLCLQQMQESKDLVDYNYHSLWPFTLYEVNPWKVMMDKFYMNILSNECSLFYSSITNKWGKILQCNFLSNEILAVTSTTDNALQSALFKVATVLQLPVVNIPSILWNMFDSSVNFTSQIVDEEKFIRLFYCNQTLSDVSAEDKAEIVTASLIKYANNKHHHPEMKQLMKSVSCIPCSPDGKQFKRPQDVMNPDSSMAKLFAPEDCVFPDKKFLQRNTLLVNALDDIGFMQILSWKMVIDRAKCIQTWYERDRDKAIDRLLVLFDCIENILKDERLKKLINNELQSIPILPAMQKPKHYPISWKGDLFESCLLAGTKLTKVQESKHSISVVYACGSQTPIFDVNVISRQQQNCSLSSNLQRILGIKYELDLNDVISHFNELLLWTQNCPKHEISDEMLEQINNMVSNIYKYFNTKLSPLIPQTYTSIFLKNKTVSSGKTHLQKRSMTDCDDLKKYLLLLKDKKCIWEGRNFILPMCVSHSWKMDGPYLYKVPVCLSRCTALTKQLEIQDKFSTCGFVTALSKMKSDYGECSLPDECQKLVRVILPELVKDNAKIQDVFLPDKDFILRNIKELKYNDAPWCVPDKNYIYCHECVEREVALRLKVEPVRNTLLQDYYIFSDDSGEEFGQEEKLTQRLYNILRDYPCDVTFLKEILQNADDAGATKLYITLDKRKHHSERVISKQWEKLQGPALLFWNDSTFSDEDLLGIQKIGLGSKRDEADKIGQYGIGFNVVYHFTDCPSFISNDRLCILDPHHHYIAHDKGKRPGKMFKDLEKIWQIFPDMKSSYLWNDLGEIPIEIKMKGSLFRLPLRNTSWHSDISNQVFSVDQLEKELKEWVSQVAEALLFVHNVTDIKLFIIDDTHSIENFMWNHSNIYFCVKICRGEEKIVKESENGSAKLVSYPVTLVVKENPATQWMVQLGEGNIEDDFDWKEIKPPNISCEPHHGIAVPLNPVNFEGKLFCYLPLPGITQLPVHIHGHFMLHSNRRGLWVSSITSKKALYAKYDPKEQWNKLLIKAIGTSYAHFLISFTSNVKPPISRSRLLRSYYNYFPTVDLNNTDTLSPLATYVYETLCKLNAPILSRLTEYPNAETDTSNKESNKKLYTTNWYQLLMPDSQNECFFYYADLPIVDVLTSIGMNLTDTPMRIYWQFKDVYDDIELSVVSDYSTLRYYAQFHRHVLNDNSLPCAISCTRFDNTENLSALLKYWMNRNTFSVKYARIASLGLIVTADGNLHCLSDGKRIISSSYWGLFPKSQQYFVHNDLRKHYPAESKYLCPNTSDHYKCIKSIIQDNYPSVMDDTKALWIKGVLNCLAKDQDFLVHCDEILENIPLIPSVNNQLYSTRSKVLPLKTTSRHFGNINRYDANKVKQFLEKLNVPLLRHDLVNSVILDRIENCLPSLLSPDDILRILFLLKESNFHLYTELSEEDLHLLFAVLKFASYSRRENQIHIMHLPIFTTTHGKLVSLATKSKVWIWNSTEVSDAGMYQWMKYVSDDVIFLSPTAPWKCILNEANNLQICPINKYDVYCDFIFPYFHHLEPDVQMAHLTFIRTEIYPMYKYTLSLKDVRKGDDNYQKEYLFACTLQKLKCIHDDTGALCCIGTFYDNNDMIFNAFCNESDFLPIVFRKGEWHDFLEYFGLKTVPSVNDFMIYCNTLRNLDSISKIKYTSSVLLTALLCSPTEGNDKYKGLQTVACFEKVLDIPIAVVEEIPELDCITAQKKGEIAVNDGESTIYLTTLSDSTSVENRYLLWTIAPLINLPSEANSKRIKDCGIIQSPSVETVIANLNSLSSTTFTDFSRFERQDAAFMIDKSFLLPEVVISMLKYIQTQLNEGKCHIDDCKRLALAQTKFLPVKVSTTTNSNEYVLVKPTQVLHAKPTNLMDAISTQVQSSHVAQFYPFLHPLIEEAHRVIDFLSSIGVQRSINFSHIQLVLQLAKNTHQDNVVDINTKQVIVKAIDELIKLLLNQKNEGKNNESDVAQYLKPLYLLSQEDKLVECSKLIVFDVVGLPQLLPPMGYYYLNPLKDDKRIRSNSLSNHLPKELGLKSLKAMLEYDIIDGTQAQEVFPSVATTGDILHSEEFKLGIELLAKCNSIDGTVPVEVTNTLENFQGNITMRYVNNFSVKAQLKMENEIIPLDNVFNDWWFLLKRSTDQKWTLIFKNTRNTYPHGVFLNLAKQL